MGPNDGVEIIDAESGELLNHLPGSGFTQSDFHEVAFSQAGRNRRVDSHHHLYATTLGVYDGWSLTIIGSIEAGKAHNSSTLTKPTARARQYSPQNSYHQGNRQVSYVRL